MKVLSLFGGIECGRVAFDRAGIKIDKYFSSEIDPYAIKITKGNYPDIIHIGSVTEVSYKRNIILKGGTISYKNSEGEAASYKTEIDILIGGSPCQDLSIAKAGGKGLEGNKSGLFYEYVRILRETMPRYFILENVASMKKIDREKITEVLREVYPDTEVHMINSALVSAQNRKRLYWTNIPGIVQPEDKNIMLQDILEDIPMDDERWKPIPEKYITEDFKVRIREATKLGYIEPAVGDAVDMAQENSKTRRGRMMKKDGKSNALLTGNQIYVIGQFRRGANLRIHADQENSPTLTSNMGTGGNNVPIIMGLAHRNRGEGKQPECNGQEKANSMTTVQSDSEILEYTGEYYWRKLTTRECERLQTLPDGYTNHVSDSRRYKAIGNGWTVDVITHILSFMK